VCLSLEKTGKQLVPVVKGHPAAVQVKASGADLVAFYLVKDNASVLDHIALFSSETRNITIGCDVLTLRQFADDVVDAFFCFGIAGLRMDERARRQIMAQTMASDRVGFPSPM